ncbi:hypothetical protein [Ralstonia phage phiRSL1]|uniref:Uncharacterized protein n=1 Tax=Ralstonia phage phiRSL1 TaxID=1980924 RepID=B2ZYC9_9CAUD|nr:hypothetical protein RSL1_ORF225 [Ralstonia phage phiRSL1]BAG41675.1 hypothetical protein [Ralstonia phage phiRSL1]
MRKQSRRVQVVDQMAEQKAVVDAYKKGALGALHALRTGSIDEEQLDKLHNFIVTSLTMMELSPLALFRKAQRVAEARSVTTEGPPVILKPENTGQQYAED